jgi:hypothetical protein
MPAPDLLDFMIKFGNTDRIASGSTNDLKEMMAVFTLVKCRSTKVLGIQLLLTLMLVARSASRQVCLYIIVTL